MTEVSPDRKRPRTRLWVGVVALLLAFGVFAAMRLQAFGPPSPAAVTSPSAPPVQRRVMALGEVLPQSDILTISAPTGQDAGRIAEIRVTEGQAVLKGDILAVLDTEPTLAAALTQAEADVFMRQAALDAKAADLAATEKKLSAQLDRERVALERSQWTLDKQTRLRDTGLYQDSALIEDRLDVESAKLSVRNSEIELDRNQLRNLQGQRLDEASATAELAAAKAARDKARVDHERAFIRAPISGSILTLYGKLGEQIGTGGFADLGDVSRMMVRAEVYEADIAEVFVGQAAAVSSRSLQAQLTGQVSRIGIRIQGQSILSSDPAAIVNARIIEVWIVLDAASSARVAALSGLQVTVGFAAKEESGA